MKTFARVCILSVGMGVVITGSALGWSDQETGVTSDQEAMQESLPQHRSYDAPDEDLGGGMRFTESHPAVKKNHAKSYASMMTARGLDVEQAGGNGVPDGPWAIEDDSEEDALS